MTKANELDKIIQSFLAPSEHYGGLPDVSVYYGCGTEYEVGLNRAIESLRCILGSLYRVRFNTPKYGFIDSLGVEKDHIEEEIGITRHVLSEYSKSLYTDERHFYLSKYKDESISRIVSGSKRLKNDAIRLLSKITGKEQIDVVSKAVYETLIAFAEASLRNTTVEDIKNNLYRDYNLIKSVNNLYVEIKKLLKG